MKSLPILAFLSCLALHYPRAAAQDSIAPSEDTVACAALNRSQSQDPALDLTDEADTAGAGAFNIFDVMCAIDSCATVAEHVTTGLANLIYRTSDVLPVNGSFASGTTCNPVLTPGCEGSGSAYLGFASIGSGLVSPLVVIPVPSPATTCAGG